jgi:hypothetical protein
MMREFFALTHPGVYGTTCARQQDLGAATPAGALLPEVLDDHESLVWNLLRNNLISV